MSLTIRYINDVTDLTFGRATATKDQASPFITSPVNVTGIQLIYDLQQKDNLHARTSETRGNANISVTTTVGGAIATSFRWSVDPAAGITDTFSVDRINWGTGFESRVIGQGANGIFVQGLMSVINATTLIFGFAPPAGAPAQLYTFSTASLQSTVKY